MVETKIEAHGTLTVDFRGSPVGPAVDSRGLPVAGVGVAEAASRGIRLSHTHPPCISRGLFDVMCQLQHRQRDGIRARRKGQKFNMIFMILIWA